MLTVVMRRPALDDMPLSRGTAASGRSAGGGPNASSGVKPAAHNPAMSSSSAPPARTYARRLKLFAIVRCPESFSHFTLFHQREGVVDVLHDDDALRRHAADDAVEKAVVYTRRIRFAVRARDERDIRTAALDDSPQHQFARRQCRKAGQFLSGAR